MLRSVARRPLVEEPARFACLCSALTLWLLPQVPFALMLLIILSLQAGAVGMAVRAARPGWSWTPGRRFHPVAFVNALTSDYATLAAGAVTGALLLVRIFNGPGPVLPLALLAAGVCLLPEIRPCRMLLSADPAVAARQLREGAFFRDPAVVGALLAAGVVLVLDAGSLAFMLVSLALFQSVPLLMFLDQSLPEVEAGGRSQAAGLLLSRDGRRVLLPLGALLLAPLRLGMGDRAASIGAAGLLAAAALPDLARLGAWALRSVGGRFRATPAAPATYIVLPK
jgi:hypothetical protein